MLESTASGLQYCSGCWVGQYDIELAKRTKLLTLGEVNRTDSNPLALLHGFHEN